VSGEYKGKGRFIRFGPPGQSDILGVLPDGRILAIEVKKPGGKKPTFEQVLFLETIRRHGGVGMVVYTLLECQEWVGEAITKGREHG